MGADLCPTLWSFLEVLEEKIDNSTVEAALEVGKVPHIKEGVKRIVEKFQKKQEDDKKEQMIFLSVWLLVTLYIFLLEHKWIFFYLLILVGFDTDKVNANYISNWNQPQPKHWSKSKCTLIELFLWWHSWGCLAWLGVKALCSAMAASGITRHFVYMKEFSVISVTCESLSQLFRLFYLDTCLDCLQVGTTPSGCLSYSGAAPAVCKCSGQEVGVVSGVVSYFGLIDN